jgi:hypothetical protein
MPDKKVRRELPNTRMASLLRHESNVDNSRTHGTGMALCRHGFRFILGPLYIIVFHNIPKDSTPPKHHGEHPSEWHKMSGHTMPEYLFAGGVLWVQMTAVAR